MLQSAFLILSGLGLPSLAIGSITRMIVSFFAVWGTGLTLTNAPSAFVILSGLGLISLVIGLIVRMIVSFFAIWGTGFNWKERFFIPVAWLPKATVQV